MFVLYHASSSDISCLQMSSYCLYQHQLASSNTLTGDSVLLPLSLSVSDSFKTEEAAKVQ